MEQYWLQAQLIRGMCIYYKWSNRHPFLNKHYLGNKSIPYAFTFVLDPPLKQMPLSNRRSTEQLLQNTTK